MSSHQSAEITAILKQVSEQLEQESLVKEGIKEAIQPIETMTKDVMAILNRLHSTPHDQVAGVVSEAYSTMESFPVEHWRNLHQRIPNGEHQKYSWAFGPIIRTLTTCVTLWAFLLSGQLAQISDVEKMMGEGQFKDKLPVSLDDYLQGVIGASNELSRLAMNAVTLGNSALSLRIAAFEKDLFAGFTLLNLRNDQLRRRFDSLKYDVKRCEDVVYDITIRNLVPKAQAQS